MNIEDQAVRWMEERTLVRAVYAAAPGVHVQGRVVGYQPAPTVVIETADGERVSWAAHLVQEAPLVLRGGRPIRPAEQQ